MNFSGHQAIYTCLNNIEGFPSTSSGHPSILANLSFVTRPHIPNHIPEESVCQRQTKSEIYSMCCTSLSLWDLGMDSLGFSPYSLFPWKLVRQEGWEKREGGENDGWAEDEKANLVNEHRSGVHWGFWDVLWKLAVCVLQHASPELSRWMAYACSYLDI